MPAIQCPGCKAPLSVKGLVDCPLCGAYLNPPHHRAATRAANSAANAIAIKSAASNAMGLGAWLGVVAIGALIVAAVTSVIAPSAEKKQHTQVISALTNCQQTIKSTAQYGDAQMPPYVQNNGSNDEFYFAWPAGSFYFINGFGAKVRMSASCTGRISTGEIQHLTVNGKDVI